jgi:hypothetical protein
MTDRSEEDHYSKKPLTLTRSGKYFSADIGDGSGSPVYFRGPFVLTFLSRGAWLSVHHGRPWETDTVKGIPIAGETFFGQVLIGKDDYVVGETNSCLMSGFYLAGKKRKK